MSLAPEDRLLLFCSRILLDENTKIKSAGLLHQPLNWEYLLEASIRHGVAPLFQHGLKQVIQYDQALKDRVPVQVSNKFEYLYQLSKNRNDRLYRAIGEIARAFDQEGIQVMGLKDLLLAKTIYIDPGLRPMGDIDLLIHFEDYERVAFLLEKLGFRQLPPGEIPYTMKYAWGHFYQRAEDGIWIDLQWNIMQIEWDKYGEGNFDFEIERVWNDSQRIEIDDFTIWSPRLEDMLFHLCHHLEGHHYTELILFCDIAELLKNSGKTIDWKYFTNLIKKYQVESSIYYPLLLTRLFFQVDIPAPVLDEIKPTYLQIGLMGALDSNLTRLHLRLDEIHTGVRPPQDVMQKFEVAIRSQAVTGMHLYREMDRVIRQFMFLGGIYISVEGTPSERLFPDLHLSAFGKLSVLVLQSDLPALRQSFMQAGFEPIPGVELDGYQKELSITTKDPVLRKQPIRVLLKTTISPDSPVGLKPLASPSSNKVASKLLVTYLAGNQSGDKLEYSLDIRITPLTPEQLLIYLSQRVGTPDQEKIFQLVRLLDFSLACSGKIDWLTVAGWAAERGFDESVARGLSTASEIMQNDAPVFPQFLCDEKWDRPAQLFKWARISPDSQDMYVRLKRPYYYLLCMIVLQGARKKLQYLNHSVCGRSGSLPVFFSVVLDAVVGSFRLLTGRHTSVPMMAYWIEPESASELMRW